MHGGPISITLTTIFIRSGIIRHSLPYVLIQFRADVLIQRKITVKNLNFLANTNIEINSAYSAHSVTIQLNIV